ncbi:TrmH family RNA methyltransferase [Psychrobacter ciconiae]|uniref:TrmH family RNA methyltransferase n=1 Tax=Psychrobacter ciconiae TaxID=1553449 RepID=UPI00191B5B4A|nr:RNA methyltransferase [Psychrobacter ciconiae]
MTPFAFEQISSDKNPAVKRVKALLSQSRQRKKLGQTVLEGAHLIEAAITSKTPIELVMLSESMHHHSEVQALLSRLAESTPVLTLTDTLYSSIKTLGTGIDILAVIDIPTPTLGDIHDDCLILNDVQDSGNVGALLRTAAAVGVSTVICTTQTAQAWSPKTLRAGMGAQFSLTIFEGVSVDEVLTSVKVPLLATSSHTQTLIYDYDLTTPVAWVMGHEGQGVDGAFLQKAAAIALPQPNGQESLNVAIAGSLCLYETLRQRRYSGK